MRRRSLVAGLAALTILLAAIASRSQSPTQGGESVELINTIAQALQSFFIMGAGVAILVVAVRGGRALGVIQEQLKGISKELGDYVERNDADHRSMQGRLGKVETRTARIEGSMEGKR